MAKIRIDKDPCTECNGQSILWDIEENEPIYCNHCRGTGLEPKILFASETDYKKVVKDLTQILTSVRLWQEKWIGDSCFCALEGMAGCSYCRSGGRELVNILDGTVEKRSIDQLNGDRLPKKGEY